MSLDISKEEEKLMEQSGFCFFIGVLGWPQNAPKHMAQLPFLIFIKHTRKKPHFEAEGVPLEKALFIQK